MEEQRMLESRKKYLLWEQAQRSHSTFSKKLLEYLSVKQMPPRTFYQRAGIDRKLFSKIKNDFCYQPNRETALRCCFALHLSLTETIDLLQSAGYALSDASSFDLAIRYCIANGIYDLSDVNMLLDALEERVFL